jgi:Tetracyclin repressor-like, C-terminal domain
MIAVHSRHPAAHRVLLEESPRGEESRGAHDRFDVECAKAYEALFIANVRGAAEPDCIGARVLAAALAGAVHEAARQGQLASPVMRQELVVLVDAYLSKPRPLTEKPASRKAR